MDLQLGDIILLHDTDNPNYNQHTFYITYISDTKIKLTDIETNIQSEILLKDGIIMNARIIQIDLLSRDKSPSYAEQNNLIPGTWINLTLGGDIPIIIVGQITNIENDMIEIKTYPDNNHIYIDFAYKGIPENIPIETIQIRDAPESTLLEEQLLDKNKEQTLDELPLYDLAINQPDIEVEDKLQEMILEGDQIIFGDTLGVINQEVEVDDINQRYDLQSQLDDMLDDMLSTIPTNKRTKDVMNSIHQNLERFKELRQQFSLYDEYGNIVGFKQSVEKPILKQLNPYQVSLFWSLPIVKNKKKIYDIDNELVLDDTGVVIKTLAEDRIDVNTIIEQYQANQGDMNSYIQYLQSLQPYFIPHEIENNIDNNFVIVSSDVLLNNSEDMYSLVYKDEELIKEQFVFDTYTKPLSYLELIKIENKKEATRKLISAYETASLNGFVLSDYNAIMASNSLCKSSTIYHKIKYKNYMYYNDLHEDTPIFIVDNNFDLPHRFKQTAIYSNLELDNNDFLNKIIPDTKDIANTIISHIQGNLSLYNYLQHFASFMINFNTILWKDSLLIQETIDRRIDEWESRYQQRLNHLMTIIPNTLNVEIDSVLYSVIKEPELQQQLVENYNINPKTSSLYLLTKLFNLDSLRLYTTILTRYNIGLYQTIDTEEFITTMDNDDKQEENDLTPEAESCQTYVLAKKYLTADELLEDNNNVIYFDKQLDPTRYDIIKDYNNERLQMKETDFLNFLNEVLVKDIGLQPNLAKREAAALILGKRIVIDGDYALLEDNTSYYKRENNSWVLDTNIPNIEIENNTFFCNIQPKCLQLKNECKDMNQLPNIQDLFAEYDIKYALKKSDMIKYIQDTELYESKRILKLRLINEHNEKIINNEYFKLGLQSADIIQDEHPEANLLNLVLREPNFVKRQENIVLFCNKYTREAGANEDIYWRYSITTKSKLIPTFILTIAKVWLDNGLYQETIERLCKEQGKISDDGECWVDKYSGYIIKTIDADTDEGYETSGFKKISREILEESVEDIVLEQSKKIADPKTEIIYIVINAITKFMGINLEHKVEYITHHVLDINRKAIPSRKIYEEKAAIIKSTKNKTVPSYESVLQQSLVIITLTYIIIAIQINIPSMKTKKTFPGCIKSFTGYPLTGKEDTSNIEYIACIAKHLSTSISPWKSITKMSVSKIVKLIILNIDKYCINDDVFKQDIQLKREYLLLDDKDIVLNELIEDWIQFMPPLTTIISRPVQGVSSAFKSKIRSNIIKLGSQLNRDVEILVSKQQHYAIEILYKVQLVVEKQKMLLVNTNDEPYLENACCISNHSTSLDFFKEEESSIGTVIGYVKEIDNILIDLVNLVKSPSILSLEDTRYPYLDIPDIYDEITIYLVVINYCNYDNLKAVPEALLPFCFDKPVEYDFRQTIKQKIELLKQLGRNYSDETLINILKLVSDTNIYHNLGKEYLLELKEFIDLEELDIEIHPFLFSLKDAIGTYYKVIPDSIKVNEKELINFLAEDKIIQLTNIKEFVSKYSTIKSNLKQKSITFLETLEEWTYTTTSNTDSIFTSIEQESALANINYLKNTIYELTVLFPNIILHKLEFINVNIPSYWKLSERHAYIIKNNIENYYQLLLKYNGNESFTQLLKNTNNYYYIKLSELLVATIGVNNTINESVLNNYLTIRILVHCLLNSINNYILQLNYIVDTIIVSDTISEVDIVSGMKLDIATELANYIIETTNHFDKHKKIVNKSYEDIMGQVNKDKEKEKEVITNRLKNLTEEARQVDTQMKNHKLGQWNLGLQKGLTQYDPDFYDKEIEQQETIEDKEAYSLEHLPEDDDYGDNDGDEGFY